MHAGSWAPSTLLDQKDIQQEDKQYGDFYIAAGAIVGATAVIATGAGVKYFGLAGVPLGVVITLRMLDLQTDWALFAISMQNERLERNTDAEFAGHLRTSSATFSAFGSILLIPGIYICVKRWQNVAGGTPYGKINKYNVIVIALTVLFEDFPQLVINAIYMDNIGDDVDAISIICMVASSLSLVFACCDAYSSYNSMDE